MTVSDDDLAAFMDEELMARRVKAMFLKNAGATLAKIAEENGVSVATVRKDLTIVRRDINNEPPIDVIARHRAVIFDIQRANYPAMMRGDKDAAATILRALDREAKLLGLDQPVKLLASVSNEDFANEAARLIERINALDPATLKELERARGHDPWIVDADVVTEAPAEAPAAPDGDTGDAQPLDGAEGDHHQDQPDVRPVAVLGPYRPGQPVIDPALDPDGQAADSGGSVTELPRRAGQGTDVQADDRQDHDDPDANWSNI